jgi:hypothetical protein
MPAGVHPFDSCCAGPPHGRISALLRHQQIVIVNCAQDQHVHLTDDEGDEIVLQGRLWVGQVNIEGWLNAISSLDIGRGVQVEKWTPGLLTRPMVGAPVETPKV